jgi:CubicO group peptidase (beta-lactamase class C family)
MGCFFQKGNQFLENNINYIRHYLKSKIMNRILVIFTFYFLLLSATLVAQQDYFPERNNWEIRLPEAFGMQADKLQAAVDFAKQNEYSGERDLRLAIIKGFEHEPFHQLLGPVKKRGGPAGMILKNGYIIAQWGDTKRVDMTFSVTKSYLSTVAGLAVQEGLIHSVDDRIGDYVWDGTFDGEHNAKITWEHLLNQSSNWSGTLWGSHDWADRPPREGGLDDWKYRELEEPGTVMEYNDVRVNLLAYSLLQVWRRPLPQILKEKILDPIGASTTWRWYGYDNSWVNVDGIQMQSVSGGGHSGGGLFINTEDQARFGLLFLRNGKWGSQQLLSSDWIKQATTPSPANVNYGFMWWLNRKGDRHWEGVPKEVFYAVGFGGNFIVIDREHDLVIVTRWLEPSKIGEMVRLTLAAF